MRYFPKDYFIIFAGTAIIAIFGFLYYRDITTKVHAGNSEVVGTIKYRRKTAERKYTGQVIWEGLEYNVPLYNNDSIRTADQSEALIALNDGTEIKLNENSMILLSSNQNQINIAFNQGSISATRGKTTGKIKDLNIKSGSTNVSINKSDVKLSQNKSGDLNLSVARGNASINTGKGEQTLGTDQAVIIDNKSGDSVKLEQNIELANPSNDSYHLASFIKMKLNFSWKKPEGPHNVYFELSKDEIFNNILKRSEVKENNTLVELEKGIYYWRVSAIQKGTKKQKFSESRRITILPDEPILAISPADKEIIGYRTVLPVINFKWTKSEIATGYRLILAADQEMKNIIKTFDTAQNNLVMDTLSKGEYFWKVEKTSGLKEIPQLASSAVFKFSINEKEIVSPPELVFPGEAKKFSKLLLKKQAITFTWKNNSDIREYLFSAAKDDKFQNIIYEEKSKVNFLRLNNELSTGSYYWRVSGILEGKESVPSPIRSFSVIDSEEIKLIIPEKNAVFTPEENEKTAPIRFSWRGNDIKGKYKLQISLSEDFSSIYNETIIHFPANSAVLQISSGKYYWKITLLDEDGSVMAGSSPLNFTVEDSLEKPAITSPLNGWVINMNNKNMLTLNWNKVPGANLYKIILYQNKKGKDYIIAEIAENTTSFKLTDLRKLDESNYSWTLQAFETGQNTNDIRRKSPMVKNLFKITLGNSVEKVNVNSLKIENL